MGGSPTRRRYAQEGGGEGGHCLQDRSAAETAPPDAKTDWRLKQLHRIALWIVM